MAMNKLQGFHQMMFSGSLDANGCNTMVKGLIDLQNGDGAWSLLEDYHVDSVIRVYYVNYPTVYVTAALMYADLSDSFETESKERKALEKEHEFAAGRGMYGHGYSAVAELLEQLSVYEMAGLYTWLKRNEACNVKFCKMIHEIIDWMKKSIAEGKTRYDWDTDYRVEFEEHVKQYEEAFSSHV